MDKEYILSTVEKLLNNPEQLFILSTLTSEGYPDARLMGNICIKTIEEIYFTCQTGSRKIDELIENSKSSVHFTSDAVTVWLYGNATVTREESERRKIWNDKVLSIYHEGVDSPRLTVIQFVPKKIRFRKKTDSYVEFDLNN